MQSRIATVIKFKGMRKRLMIVDLKRLNMNCEVDNDHVCHLWELGSMTLLKVAKAGK